MWAWVLPCLPAVSPMQGHLGCPVPSYHALGSSRHHQSQTWGPMCTFMFGMLLYPRCSGRTCESEHVPAVMEGSMLQHIPVGQMAWGPRALSPWRTVPGAAVASPGMLEKRRSFSCSRACGSARVLPSLWAQGGLHPEAGSFTARGWPSHGAVAGWLPAREQEQRRGWSVSPAACSLCSHNK